MTNSNKLADALRDIVNMLREHPAMQGREYIGLGIAANNALREYDAALAEHDAQPAPAPVQVDGWCSECGCGGSGYAHLAGCVNLRPPARAAIAALRQPVPDAARELPEKWRRDSDGWYGDDFNRGRQAAAMKCADELDAALASQQESRNAD
jgi:hypothetical protein